MILQSFLILVQACNFEPPIVQDFGSEVDAGLSLRRPPPSSSTPACRIHRLREAHRRCRQELGCHEPINTVFAKTTIRYSKILDVLFQDTGCSIPRYRMCYYKIQDMLFQDTGCAIPGQNQNKKYIKGKPAASQVFLLCIISWHDATRVSQHCLMLQE